MKSGTKSTAPEERIGKFTNVSSNRAHGMRAVEGGLPGPAHSRIRNAVWIWDARRRAFFCRATDLLADPPELLVRDKAPPPSAARVFSLADLSRPAGSLWLVLCVRPQPLKNGIGVPHSKER